MLLVFIILEWKGQMKRYISALSPQVGTIVSRSAKLQVVGKLFFHIYF